MKVQGESIERPLKKPSLLPLLPAATPMQQDETQQKVHLVHVIG